MQLSQNFKLTEFLVSDTATDLGYQLVADLFAIENLQRLVDTVLQPARDEIGQPFVITSGFRPPWLNELIRGSNNSDHLYGCAVDFVVLDRDQTEVFEIMRDMQLPINQLINELPPNGWIHASINKPGKPAKGQYLRAESNNGTIVYRHV